MGSARFLSSRFLALAIVNIVLASQVRGEEFVRSVALNGQMSDKFSSSSVHSVTFSTLHSTSGSAARNESSAVPAERVDSPPAPAAANPPAPLVERQMPPRPKPLLPLYGAFAVVNALDVHSTRRGLAAGAKEGNPLLAGLAQNTTALIALKGAIATGAVLWAENTWKRGHRKMAVATLLAMNGFYGWVAYHNYQVVSAARR